MHGAALDTRHSTRSTAAVTVCFQLESSNYCALTNWLYIHLLIFNYADFQTSDDVRHECFIQSDVSEGSKTVIIMI